MHTEPRSFATQPGGALAPSNGYWWGALVSEEVYVGLIRDIEAVKGKQSTHEAECALRYRRIEENTASIKQSVESLATDLGALARQGNHAAWSANWKAWLIAATIGAALLGGLAWTLGQLYALEPLRVRQETPK